MDLEARKDYC